MQTEPLPVIVETPLFCKVWPPIKPDFYFITEGEVFDSFHYAAELAAAYQRIYSLFEKNPNNFKALDKGMLHIRLKSSCMTYEFDTILEGNTTKNKKVFEFIAPKIVSEHFTDRKSLELKIYVRKSHLVSASLDTMDLSISGKWFKDKSSGDFIISGKSYGNASALLSHAALYRPAPYSGEEDKNEVYFNLSEEAAFPGGNDKFTDYLSDNFYLPEECNMIWQESTFDCNIRFNIRINERGFMDSVNFISFNPRYNYKSRFYDLICKELKRCIKRTSPLWKPKRAGLKYIYTYYAFTLKIRRMED